MTSGSRITQSSSWWGAMLHTLVAFFTSPSIVIWILLEAEAARIKCCDVEWLKKRQILVFSKHQGYFALPQNKRSSHNGSVSYSFTGAHAIFISREPMSKAYYTLCFLILHLGPSWKLIMHLAHITYFTSLFIVWMPAHKRRSWLIFANIHDIRWLRLYKHRMINWRNQYVILLLYFTQGFYLHKKGENMF